MGECRGGVGTSANALRSNCPPNVASVVNVGAARKRGDGQERRLDGHSVLLLGEDDIGGTEDREENG